MNRVGALVVATALAYIALRALGAGIRQPDYILVLFGLLFLTLAAIAVLLGFRRAEA